MLDVSRMPPTPRDQRVRRAEPLLDLAPTSPHSSMSTRIASGSPAMSLSSRLMLLIGVSSLGGREWCLETEETSIGVANGHHLGTPMASCERPDYLHGLARSDVIGIRHP
jgi:hypothetical protein